MMRKSSGNRKQSKKSAARARTNAAQTENSFQEPAESTPPHTDAVAVAEPIAKPIEDDMDMMSRFEQLDAALELPGNSESSTSSIDPAQVAEIADSSRQILQAVANQGDAISQLAAALGAMRESIQDISAAKSQASPLFSAEPELEAPQDEEESASDDGLNPWEQIKNAILESHEEVVEPAEQTSESVVAAVEDDSPIDEECGVLFELVSQDDIDDMDESRLRALVIDQERIISRLARRVQQKSRRDLQLTPEQLQECAKNLPDELAVRVEATLQTLDEQARLGELELSLERARISRQLSQLEETRNIVESNARHLGMEIDSDGKIEGSTAVSRIAGSKGRRWLGALGFVE